MIGQAPEKLKAAEATATTARSPPARAEELVAPKGWGTGRLRVVVAANLFVRHFSCDGRALDALLNFLIGAGRRVVFRAKGHVRIAAIRDMKRINHAIFLDSLLVECDA